MPWTSPAVDSFLWVYATRELGTVHKIIAHATNWVHTAVAVAYCFCLAKDAGFKVFTSNF